MDIDTAFFNIMIYTLKRMVHHSTVCDYKAPLSAQGVEYGTVDNSRGNIQVYIISLSYEFTPLAHGTYSIHIPVGDEQLQEAIVMMIRVIDHNGACTHIMPTQFDYRHATLMYVQHLAVNSLHGMVQRELAV